MISSPDFEFGQDDCLTEYYGLRADTLLAIHIDPELWQAFIESRR